MNTSIYSKDDISVMESSPQYEQSSLDNQPATSPEPQLAWSAIDEPPTPPSELEQAMDAVARQRQAVSHTAEQVRRGELQLSDQESQELGRHALKLALDNYTDPAVAERFMVDYAASVKTPDAIVGAYHTINRRFEHSSEDHRQSSRDIAARAIALTNHEVTPDQAMLLAQEQAFEDRFGNSSEDALAKMLELTRLFQAYNKSYDDLDHSDQKTDKIQTGRRLINTTYTLLDQIRTSSHETAPNSRAELQALILAEAVAKKIEIAGLATPDASMDENTIRQIKNIQADADDLIAEVDDIIKQAPADQVDGFELARHIADDPRLFRRWLEQHFTSAQTESYRLDRADIKKTAA